VKIKRKMPTCRGTRPQPPARSAWGLEPARGGAESKEKTFGGGQGGRGFVVQKGQRGEDGKKKKAKQNRHPLGEGRETKKKMYPPQNRS